MKSISVKLPLVGFFIFIVLLLTSFASAEKEGKQLVDSVVPSAPETTKEDSNGIVSTLTDIVLNKMNKDSGKRGSSGKRTFPISFPQLFPTQMNPTDPTHPTAVDPNNPNFGMLGLEGLGPLAATFGSSAFLVKGGLLSALGILKAFIVPPILLGAVILFLIAGAAFFVCNLMDCSNTFGSLGLRDGLGSFLNPGSHNSGNPSFGVSGSSNPFNRVYEMDQHLTRPVYQALDEGYKKYGNGNNVNSN